MKCKSQVQLLSKYKVQYTNGTIRFLLAGYSLNFCLYQWWLIAAASV